MQYQFLIFCSLLWLGCNFVTPQNEPQAAISPVMDSLNNKELLVELTVLDEDSIKIKVTNISDKMLRLYSHVEADIRHYDYFEVEAITPDNEHLYFSFVGDRDKSAPVILELEPNKSFEHEINLLEWANSAYNQRTLKTIGFNHLSSFKFFKMRAKYFNQPCEDCSDYYKSIWSGYCYSEWTK